MAVNALSIFYDRLKDLRDLHRNDDETDIAAPVSVAAAIDEIDGIAVFLFAFLGIAHRWSFSLFSEPVLFSGPEAYGRYLDLNVFHTRALNMKQFDKIDYLNFLRIFHKFDRIAKEQKNADYREYVFFLCSD